LLTVPPQIGLDDLKTGATGAPLAPRTDLDNQLTEEMRRSSEAAAWGKNPLVLDGADALAPAAQAPAAATAAADAAPAAADAPPAEASPQPLPGKLPDLSKLSE
jgi:hypothetical protein